MRTYRVGTFLHDPKKRPVKSRIMAYTSVYSPEWEGCIEYTVEAGSGKEAKEKAVALRLARELEIWRARERDLDWRDHGDA